MKKQEVIKLLSEFIEIESVSSDSLRKKEMKKAVGFLKGLLTEIGCEVKILDGDAGPGLVMGIIKVPDAKKTIGIYGHYDVQHEDPVKDWISVPYRLTRRSGKLFGRGVADNKGHVIQNIVAVSELKKQGKLYHNIVFLIEGEEEIGSERFESLLKKNSRLLRQIDVFFVTDVNMHAKNVPLLYYALRGLVYFEIDVSIGPRDLHSGVYGNSVYNPAQLLHELFFRMKDNKTGKILIPGFYDNVRKINDDELKLLGKAAVSDKQIKKETGANILFQGKYPPYLSPKILPSMDINGVISGHTGEGPKTIIPHRATAKFSFRLVEHQNPKDIAQKVKKFIHQQIPKDITCRLHQLASDSPFYTAIDNEYINKTGKLLSEHFGNKTLYDRAGGSVPAAEILQRNYGTPIILTGFTLPDDNIHAPNENFDEEMFWSGIEALKKVYNSL
ncbi:hypothetical protein A3A93_03055 [Candidatus Roizmanbacteria bacterium RIFCSPLOWO2_01_FULL_38_12]|uniref:Peptidase M20 dimerisation domain-containing protein n=1 Tax=Candidatus Roizmanbacteria bacterium RIFCSPLOWO2_01_FULL_38_12 TaxID=1802061 RepID=A0A1F7IZJ4_9BACT|nr:MAG: hypothetical protein A2861_02810 [Candidatus Roizmanbacteria bacterium RIFCSPHIGHO2_01_FULL_38_15]OGK35363.1 MAG: hypothetical protein A3F59_06155 [Candidatus Roizmanbacteria bacterium RIFCSPHIGHO2_12_FULL_38_13]OGK48777.1 MAG: hypothetical protein A3A93_03055 [Candidatus Roizmanbacteria bacterium RIFCSPLOWO2_01_FULL_38_12]